MLHTAEFWILLCLIIFIGILIYMKVPRAIAGGLDKKSTLIANEIEQARRLREEAEALLASYKQKQAEAMKEAESIILQAKAEAEALAAESRKNLEAQVQRRQQMAETKIRQAETQAVQEVRSAAADIAVNAAQKLIAEKVDAGKDASLIEKSIGDLAGKLH